MTPPTLPLWMLHNNDPCRTLLYRLYDGEMGLLYIGIVTNSLWDRIVRHRREKLWGASIQHYSTEFCPIEWQALEAERAAIKNELPLHNIRSAVASGA